MDETGQRLRNCAENCINAYEAWQGSRQNVAARESLQEAVHELRKVAAKLEIEVAISEREELTQRPIPIPPHRAARRRDQSGSELPDFILDSPRSSRQGSDYSGDENDQNGSAAYGTNSSGSGTLSSGSSSRGSQNRHMGQRRSTQNRRPQQPQGQQHGSNSENQPKEFAPRPIRDAQETPQNRDGTMSLGNMNTIISNNPSNNLSNNSGPTPEAAQPTEFSSPPSYEDR